MIIGTAGHIDHGKTSLVKALTGIDTDRLPEEKARGITIELGFAHLELGDGTVAGVVDVPGHERFVKAMAAGAGGVDLALFVIAADEGVMPQTREHLDICELLGVKAGVIALTKADLLEELGADWLDLLEADVRALVAGTFLEGAPMVCCSAKTGQGLKELLAALTERAQALPRRFSEGPAFLPIDRAFTIRGFGTVVTGTLLSGRLVLEEQVSLLPGLEGPLRVRGLQVHGQVRERVEAGQRVAVNLAGVETEAIWRGMALTRFEELFPTRMLDVELELLPAVETPLPKRSKLLLHLGTAQTEATVALLDADELKGGQRAFAQLRLASPVAALPGQRFILRGSKAIKDRGATLGGGKVLLVDPPRRRKGASMLMAPLRDADDVSRVGWLIRQSGYAGLTPKELFARSGLSEKALKGALDLLGARGAVLLVDKEKRRYLSSEVFSAIAQRALAALEAFHAQRPLEEGMGKEELRQRLGISERVLARLLAHLIESNELESSGERVRLKGRGRTFTESDASMRQRLVEELKSANLAPPTVNELSGRVKLPPERVIELLRAAVAEGLVVKVTDELYFAKGAVDALKEKLVAHLKEHREISTQAFKEMVGQTRKFVIPLSEFFDREKVTLRVGDKRVLRRA